jgi:hypothetical protein
MILVAPMVLIVLAQSPTVTLSGTVAGPDGRPVAGAEVWLVGLPDYAPPNVRRGRTDAEGRFAIECPAGPADETSYIIPRLWVYKPGLRLSMTAFTDALPGAGKLVRVVLGPAARAEVAVDGPDGRPVAGARVRVERFGPGSVNLLEEVEDRLETRTGPDGLAVIAGVANEDVTWVDVVSEAFGVQGRLFSHPSARPKLVRLRATAALEGRVVADDPARLQGWEVRAYTGVQVWGSRDQETTGFARSTTDEQGRFSFPVIAPGPLRLELKPPRDLPVKADVPTSVSVVAGRKNSCEVPLRKPATIAGRIVERGTGRPIPGAVVHISPSGGGLVTTAKTDEQGRYTFKSLPGSSRISLFEPPRTHAFGPGQHWRDFAVPVGAPRVEVEPIEAIPAAPPLRFVVRDEQGRTVSHAAIRGSYDPYLPKESDDRGEFAVPGMAPGQRIQFEVLQGDRMTEAPVEAEAGGTDPVGITIRPGLAIALAGRVLGPGGAPIPGVLVSARFRETGSNRPQFAQRFQFGGRGEVHTGPDGTFRTPREVCRNGREFRVEVSAEGYLSDKTDWVACEGGDRLTLPDVVLHAEPTPRAMAGLVIDRQGKGVAGASVFSAIGDPWATTDGEGRFRIAEVPGGTALVFVEKAGFRFGGAVVGPADGRVEIRMARTDEPPPSIPKPQSPPLSRAQERGWAREWLGPLVANAPARVGSRGQMAQRVMQVLARVDPDRVLQMTENRAVRLIPDVLDAVALGQFEVDPAAAVATIEADREPAVRVKAYLAIADAVPAADRAGRIHWVERAQAEARLIEKPESRLGFLGQIADRWLDLGLLDRARPILLEGRRILASMPAAQYAPAAASFAEVLAAIDLPTARTILKARVMAYAGDITGMVNRHLGEAAVRLAAVDPAEAERLIPDGVSYRGDPTQDLLRIGRRMARADLPRARRILEAMGRRTDRAWDSWPVLQAQGLGLLAIERAAIDPAGARRLLDEACDRLREIAIAESRTRGGLTTVNGRTQAGAVSVAMAALLPTVERLEPNRLRERLWLTAAVVPPVSDVPYHDLTPWLVVATFVSRYDRDMAASIIASALARLPMKIADSNLYLSRESTSIRALAAYDPRAVAALLDALPGSARKDPAPGAAWNTASLDTQIRLIAAEILGLPVEQQFRNLLERDFQLQLFGQDR